MGALAQGTPWAAVAAGAGAGGLEYDYTYTPGVLYYPERPPHLPTRGGPGGALLVLRLHGHSLGSSLASCGSATCGVCVALRLSALLPRAAAAPLAVLAHTHSHIYLAVPLSMVALFQPVALPGFWRVA